jgi:hypothetical protein
VKRQQRLIPRRRALPSGAAPQCRAPAARPQSLKLRRGPKPKEVQATITLLEVGKMMDIEALDHPVMGLTYRMLALWRCVQGK